MLFEFIVIFNHSMDTFSQTRGTPKKTVGLASFKVEISVP